MQTKPQVKTTKTGEDKAHMQGVAYIAMSSSPPEGTPQNNAQLNFGNFTGTVEVGESPIVVLDVRPLDLRPGPSKLHKLHACVCGRAGPRQEKYLMGACHFFPIVLNDKRLAL